MCLILADSDWRYSWGWFQRRHCHWWPFLPELWTIWRWTFELFPRLVAPKFSPFLFLLFIFFFQESSPNRTPPPLRWPPQPLQFNPTAAPTDILCVGYMGSVLTTAKCVTSGTIALMAQMNSIAVQLLAPLRISPYWVCCPSWHFPYNSVLAVKERCDFEDDETCGWTVVGSAVHAFHWSPDQGESIHNGEEYHRPVYDHTL